MKPAPTHRRPQLESLEARLPTGGLLFGATVGPAWLGLALLAPDGAARPIPGGARVQTFTPPAERAGAESARGVGGLNATAEPPSAPAWVVPNENADPAPRPAPSEFEVGDLFAVPPAPPHGPAASPDPDGARAHAGGPGDAPASPSGGGILGSAAGGGPGVAGAVAAAPFVIPAAGIAAPATPTSPVPTGAPAPAPTAAHPNTATPDPRNVVSLDAAWKFLRADVSGAQQPIFNDSAWSTVNVPHTWNNLDGQQGGAYYRGVGWYRRHYAVPADQAGKEFVLKFDGASLVADLYVNGTFVGEHVGGFAAFSWDMTPNLVVGGDNVFAVKVNNAYSADIAPLSGDFSIDGGIYRHVNLIATDPLHVSLTDNASPGVYLQQTNVSAASADLQITTELRNDGPAARTATVQAQILDATGGVVRTLTGTQALAAGAAVNVVQNTTLANPHLWNGRGDPYLYQVAVSVLDGTSGATVDRVQQPLGLRFYRIDPAAGFSLNGQPYDLHGVDFHQDRLDEGWAISDADQIQDVGLVQEIGATFVRLAHYQHPALTYDLLDQAGILAWTEIPLVNSVTNSQAFFDNAKQQLRELIRQNYNHPSVIVWGMYNEIVDDAPTRSLVTQLVQLAHAEDPTRPTTAASSESAGAVTNYIPDTVSFNQYFGWYGGRTGDFGPWADTIHRNYPTRAIGVSEFGAGASIYQHEANPAPPDPFGLWHPEEYQALFHEATWAQIATRPFLWEKSVWNMFDFASYWRNEGDTPGRNDKGLVTYDRQTRKDAFYFYKANWSADPVVYLTGRREINRPAGPTDVKIYSNLDSVELFVNGVSLGTQTSPDHIFRWSNVVLAPGTNAVAAVGRRGAAMTTDSVTWYTPYALAGVPFLSVNFQPQGVAVPPGYVADSGAVYGYRGNGFFYGWDADNSAYTRVRHVASDPRYDTLTHMQRGGGSVWQVAVPNGVYDVHLVSGDPSYLDSVYEINLNGGLAVSGGVHTGHNYQEAWRRVTVRDGRLTVSNAAGARNNKIDFIDITQVSAAPVDYANGFFDSTGLSLNGGAVLTADYKLRLTDGGPNEARSAFTAAPVNARRFSTGFWFQLSNPDADGFAFVLQTSGPGALGQSGGGLGYAGIGRSAAIKFDLYDNAVEGGNSTGLFLNGAYPSGPGSVDLTGTGIDLHSGDLFYAEVDYDGATLSVLIYDTATGAAAVQAYSVDLASVLGGSVAYAGFTAGTGGQTATQDIFWWTYTPQ